MKKTRILFADDHGIVRDGLRMLFSNVPDITVVGEAADGEAAVRMASSLKPDLAILDISMPKVNGIQATRIIKERHPEIKVLILTIHEDEEYVFEMIKAGANGYVVKNAEKNEILSAVRTVMTEGTFFSPGISKLMIDRFVQRTRSGGDETASARPVLTKREREILSHIAQGLSSREIAERLFLSVSTVNTHRANLMQKLDIHDTATLVRYAIRSGIVNIDAPQ